jgi:hypothetical protein
MKQAMFERQLLLNISRNDTKLNLRMLYILKRGLMTPTDRALLSQRDMPLVVVLGREQRLLYYPAEICYVCDNQRVKTQQMLPQMTQKMIEVSLTLCPKVFQTFYHFHFQKCAVPPARLRRQNDNVVASFNMQSGILAAAQMAVSQQPFTVVNILLGVG